MVTIHGTVSGRVQGVGFRYFVKKSAEKHGVTGWAKNLSDGRVEFQLQGSSAAIEQLTKLLHRGPALAHVSDMTVNLLDNAAPITGFGIG